MIEGIAALSFDPAWLKKIATTRMPFGKYTNRLLMDLPENYLVWFWRQGFPEGELGRMLEQVYEIKRHGLEYLMKPLLPTSLGDEKS